MIFADCIVTNYRPDIADQYSIEYYIPEQSIQSSSKSSCVNVDKDTIQIVKKSVTEKYRSLSHHYLNLSSVKNKCTQFKDLIYIWVQRQVERSYSEGEFPILNTKDAPFLQSAIAHSKFYRTKILYYVPNSKKNTMSNFKVGFNNLKLEFLKNNICIDLINLDEKIIDQWLLNILNKGTCIGVKVDLLKMWSGCHLDIFGLDNAIIADFDVELPQTISFPLNDIKLLPLIVPFQRYIKSFGSGFDHPIENIYLFVVGRYNDIFNKMLSYLKSNNENMSVFKTYETHVIEVIKHFCYVFNIDINDKPNDYLLEYFGQYDCFPEPIKNLCNKLDIKFDRGGTWKDTAKQTISRKVNFVAGAYPIYPRELSELYRSILFNNNQYRIINRIKFLLDKGYAVDSLFSWSNGLQREGTILEVVIDRVTDENVLLPVIKYLLDNNATINQEVLETIKNKVDIDKTKELLFNKVQKTDK